MNIKPNGISYLLSLLLASTFLVSACGDVKPLSFGMSADLSWEQLVTEGQNAYRAGKIDVAEKKYVEAVQKCEEKFGEDDARTGNCVGYLAELYKYKQDWLKAEKEYKKWLTIMDKHDSTGEQVKVIRKGYSEVKEKIKKYGLKADPTEASDSEASE